MAVLATILSFPFHISAIDLTENNIPFVFNVKSVTIISCGHASKRHCHYGRHDSPSLDIDVLIDGVFVYRPALARVA